MKPLFCLDITESKNNEQPNGCDTDLLVQKPSDMLINSHDRIVEQTQTLESRAQLPTFLNLIRNLCGMAALLLAAGLSKALLSVSLAQAYHNAAWVFFVAPICAVVWGVLTLMARHRKTTVLGDDTAGRTFSRLENSQKAIFDELGVPEDATAVDVLVFRYTVRNGQIKPKELMPSTPYIATQMQLFADEDRLYLAEISGKYAIPRSALRAIRTVKKRINFYGWNKDEKPRSKRFKPYKLGANQYGCIICRWYHILELELDGETWGIYFPPHERPAFESATGMRAE